MDPDAMLSSVHQETHKSGFQGVADSVSDLIDYAAAYIDDAFSGRCRFGRGFVRTKGPNKAILYNLQFHPVFRTLLAAAFAVDLALPLMANLLGHSILLAAHCVVLVAVALAVLLELVLMSAKIFFRKPRCVLEISLTVLEIVLVAAGAKYPWWFFAMPWIAVMLFSTLWDLTQTIIKTSIIIAEFVPLLIILMVFFSALGTKLFHGIYISWNSSANFDSFGNAMLSLFMLLTTETYPDAMAPAFTNSRWATAYFAVYVVVLSIFAMSAIIAAFIQAYKQSIMKRAVEEKDKEFTACAFGFVYLRRAQQLLQGPQTFDMLVTLSRPPSPEDKISSLLFEEMAKLVEPKHLDLHQIQDIFLHRKECNLTEFYECCQNLSQVISSNKAKISQLETNSNRTFIQVHKYPFLAKIAKSLFTRRLLLLQFILVIIYSSLLIANSQIWICQLILYFSFVCCILDIILLPSGRYISLYEMIDKALTLITTFLLLISYIYYIFCGGQLSCRTSSVTFRDTSLCLLILRMLTLVGLLRNDTRHSYQSDEVIKTYAPLLWHFAVIMFSVFYTFSSLGVAFFSEKVTQQHSVLLIPYFKTYSDSFLSMFQIFVGNNWEEIFFGTLNSPSLSYAWIFFVSYFCIMILTLLHLLVALLSDAFVARQVLMEKMPVGNQNSLNTTFETATHEPIELPNLNSRRSSLIHSKVDFDNAEFRAPSITASSFRRSGFSGKGFTWRAIANVVSEVDSRNQFFKVQEGDSEAKRKWKLASRILVERNRLVRDLPDAHSKKSEPDDIKERYQIYGKPSDIEQGLGLEEIDEEKQFEIPLSPSQTHQENHSIKKLQERPSANNLLRKPTGLSENIFFTPAEKEDILHDQKLEAT